MIGASLVVFAGYYMSFIAGETLADEQVISPFLGMWTGNALFLAAALLLLWRAGAPAPRVPWRPRRRRVMTSVEIRASRGRARLPARLYVWSV